MELDKNMIGLTSEPYRFEIENRHVRQFREAIGDDHPLYQDEAYANESLYEGIIVPPTFPVAMNGEDVALPIELDHRRMLHGEQEFIYHQPIRPGDRLQCQMKISDIYDREGKSGNMQFLVLDTEMRNEAGELVCVSRMNIIYRSLS